jgi:PAS domain S-box-containing protein
MAQPTHHKAKSLRSKAASAEQDLAGPLPPKAIEAVFDAAPGLYLILKPDAPRFSIMAVNNAYAKATLTKREDIIGKGLFEVFPDNPSDPNATGVANLTASLMKVLKTKLPQAMANQKYDIPKPKGGFEERWWSPLNTPVLDRSGNVSCIIHSVTDVTQTIRLQEKEQSAQKKINQQADIIRAKQELETERQRLHQVLMQTPSMVAIMRGPNHVFELANPLYLQVTSKPANIIGKPVREVFPELEGRDIFKILDNTYKTGRPFVGNHMPVQINRHGRPEELYFNFVYQPYRNAQGNVEGIIVHGFEVTEQVLAQRHSEESEARLRFMAESMPQKVFTAKPTGEIDYFNPQWINFTGLSFDDIKDWGWKQFIHPDDLAENLRRWQHSIDTGEPFELEHRYRRHDGVYRWHLSRAQAQRDNKGNIVMWVGSNTEIHDQKETEEQLKKQRERLELAQKAAKIGTFEWDLRTNRLAWTRELEALYGLDPSTFDGTYSGWLNMVHPEDQSHAHQSMQQAAKGVELNTEFRIVCPDGTVCWLAIRGRVFCDDNGEPIRMLGISRNVTKRKRAEEALKMSEERFRTLVEQSPISIQIFSPDGETLQVNPAWEELWGAPREHLRGYNILEDPQLHTKGLLPYIKRGFAGNVVQIPPVEYDPAEIGKPGRARWIEATIYPIRSHDGQIKEVVLIHLDSTEAMRSHKELERLVAERTAELQRANEELSKSEARLSEAQELANLGSWEWNVNSEQVHWSQALYRIYGMDPSLPITYQNYLRRIHPDDRNLVEERINNAVQGKISEFSFEHQIVRADGEIRVIHAMGRVFRDAGGQVTKLAGTGQDITESKRIEQLKSDFVSMVSHQLKTPAAIIRGYVDNLLSGIIGKLNPKQREYVKGIEEISTRNYNLINDLLNVSRIERGVISADLKPVPLLEVMQLSIRNYQQRISRKGIGFRLHDEAPGALVLADQAKFAEAIGNAIDNAIKFTAKGSITIRTWEKGQHAFVKIEDTGKGMSSHTLNKLFQRDQIFGGGVTPEAGSGLGLYIAKQFMHIQHGDIEARSTPGHGSAFIFKIPLAPKPAKK